MCYYVITYNNIFYVIYILIYNLYIYKLHTYVYVCRFLVFFFFFRTKFSQHIRKKDRRGKDERCQEKLSAE